MLAEIPEINLDDVVLQSEEGIVDAKLLTRKELVTMLRQQDLSDGITLTCLARYWMWREQRASEHLGEA